MIVQVNKDDFVEKLHEAFQANMADLVIPHMTSTPPYRRVALGGTFDHLHAAHRLMITVAMCAASESVVIGLTSPEMITHKRHHELIQSLEVRKQAIQAFVKSLESSVRLDLVTLTDPYGPTIEDPTIEALVVSEETKGAGDRINEIRRSKGMPPVSLIQIGNLYLPDGQMLSSTLIRSQIK